MGIMSQVFEAAGIPDKVHRPKRRSDGTYELQEGTNILADLSITKHNDTYKVQSNKQLDKMWVYRYFPEFNLQERAESGLLTLPLQASKEYKPDLTQPGLLLLEVGVNSYKTSNNGWVVRPKSLIPRLVPELVDHEVEYAGTGIITFNLNGIIGVHLLNNTNETMHLAGKDIPSGKDFWLASVFISENHISVNDFDLKIVRGCGLVATCKLENTRAKVVNICENPHAANGFKIKSNMQRLLTDGILVESVKATTDVKYTLLAKLKYNDRCVGYLIERDLGEQEEKQYRVFSRLNMIKSFNTIDKATFSNFSIDKVYGKDYIKIKDEYKVTEVNLGESFSEFKSKCNHIDFSITEGKGVYHILAQNTRTMIELMRLDNIPKKYWR